MAIKPGWEFPSPAGASTRGYTRERGVGEKSPAVGRDETQKNAPTFHSRDNPRDGRYASNDRFAAMTPLKSSAADEHRTGRQAKQTNEPRKFAKGGTVKKAEGGGNWIESATENKGGLHRSLGVPEGDKIPAKKLSAGAKSKSPKIRKEVALARTLKGLNKG